MVNPANWEYDTTITIRVKTGSKMKLQEEARTRGISVSEHIRDVLTRAELPEQLFARLTPQHRQRIERLSQRSGRSVADVMQQTIGLGLPYYLDNANVGF